MTMDLKLVFVVVVLIVGVYRMEVNSDADEFAVILCKRFQLSRNMLYEVVTTANMVDKWIDWVQTFMEADDKRLGMGKQFKAFYHDNAGATVFKVTGFDEGNYLIVESNFLFSPRVELYFFEKQSKQSKDLQERNVTSWSVYKNLCSRHQTKKVTSELGVRVTIKSSSALFQHIVGISVRAFLRKEIRRILDNLEAFVHHYAVWEEYLRVKIYV